jgi:signal peptidase I
MPRADFRRCLHFLVLLVCGGTLVQAFALEPFQVPTGSMAPTLAGCRRLCTCPRCGIEVAVGKPAADRPSRAFCPNCGEQPMPLAELPETAGDHVLVNKAAFAFRRPRRWEVVVFRLFGITFIKRIVGLPGETILIEDGDVYIDGQLARKSFEQALAMRVPIFDQRHPPTPGDAAELLLDGRDEPQTWTYPKSSPLVDEYAYNGGLHPGREPVHDFLLEADVEVQAGAGTLTLRLCDGSDWVGVALPVTELPAGETHHVEMAFVDRRVNLAVDGRRLVEDVDLPMPAARSAVRQPVELTAAGVAVAVRNLRLYRDIHYTSRGRQAVGGEPVRLGVEQYFVLGDNSGNSEDSRFWPAGAVAAPQLLGAAFLVYLPSRAWREPWQLPDFGRIRWIR